MKTEACTTYVSKIEDAQTYALKVLGDPDITTKKDGLDYYRNIIRFLANDIITDDVPTYRKYNKPWQFKIRNNILSQLNKWTLKQIKDYYELLNDAIKDGWVDKPGE